MSNIICLAFCKLLTIVFHHCFCVFLHEKNALIVKSSKQSCYAALCNEMTCPRIDIFYFMLTFLQVHALVFRILGSCYRVLRLGFKVLGFKIVDSYIKACSNVFKNYLLFIKNKGTTKCDNSMTICDISNAKCDYGTNQCN